jgi:hypothetical protein
MARKRIYEYVFTPGTAGLGTVQVQDRINLEDFLAIYDTTTNTSQSTTLEHPHRVAQ